MESLEDDWPEADTSQVNSTVIRKRKLKKKKKKKRVNDITVGFENELQTLQEQKEEDEKIVTKVINNKVNFGTSSDVGYKVATISSKQSRSGTGTSETSSESSSVTGSKTSKSLLSVKKPVSSTKSLLSIKKPVSSKYELPMDDSPAIVDNYEDNTSPSKPLASPAIVDIYNDNPSPQRQQKSPQYSENFATPFMDKSGISDAQKEVIEVLNKPQHQELVSDYLIEKRPENSRRATRISKLSNNSTVKGSIGPSVPVTNNSTRLPQKISFKDQLTNEMSDLKSQLNIENPKAEFDVKTNKTLLGSSSKKQSFVMSEMKEQQIRDQQDQNREIIVNPVYRQSISSSSKPGVIQELQKLNQECQLQVQTNQMDLIQTIKNNIPDDEDEEYAGEEFYEPPKNQRLNTQIENKISPPKPKIHAKTPKLSYQSDTFIPTKVQVPKTTKIQLHKKVFKAAPLTSKSSSVGKIIGPIDPISQSQKLLRQIDIFLNVKNQNLQNRKNVHFEEFELKNEQKQISQHLVDLSSCLNNLIQNGDKIATKVANKNSLPALKIKKKKIKPLSSFHRSSSGYSRPSGGDLSHGSVIPRVASIQAWPKHKLNVRGEYIRGPKAEGDPQLSSRLVDSHKIDYLNMRPTIEHVEKELTNNRIKIMNMKTDFVRLKKLIAKIQNKKQSQKQQQSQSCYQLKQEGEFNITGVNQYKTQLEQNIQILTKKVKELQRKNHYAEIIEKRLDKEHNEKLVFVANEEKEKGMSALRQLEFQKNKIDKINETLQQNVEKRRKDTQKINTLTEQIINDQNLLESLPQAKLSQAEINHRFIHLQNHLSKLTSQKILRERTLQIQIQTNSDTIFQNQHNIGVLASLEQQNIQ